MYKKIGKIALGALVSLALVAPAMAKPAGKGQITFVPGHLSAAADIQMPIEKAAKIKLMFAGADKDGLGGYEVKLPGNAKLTCASNNDTKGLCGPKDNPQPAILKLLWKVLANIEIENVATLRITGGKIVFEDTGKNKSNAGGNVAASTVYNTAIVTGYATIHDRAATWEDPTLGCNGPPTKFKTLCYNPIDSMAAGFMYGFDLTNSCTLDSECELSGPTLYCNLVTGFCAIQQCTVDGDCNSGACNTETGNCCDPTAGAGEPGECPEPSPSGAFLDTVQF
jgi:hypothetical protein